ncbi:MAG: DNA mismatch repair endonuclease MutL [Clostridia bacterium]|nr:DNA mismatch repair endonuclease MutL [Clostridia bacterium]
MNKIKILDNDISDLIAAGEVVERPASVVKELVENSIDAGAKKITIEIVGSGIDYIRITDDGCGMSPDDAKAAFKKHATSKISTKADLYSINTLGFRGEALAAISAVSKILLKTKEQSSVSGYYVSLEGGRIIDEGDIGLSDGTTIEVRNLFYNTPARLKFVKSEQTERAAISSLIEKLAISHTDIAFSYIINGVQRFFTSANGSLDNAAYSVFGSELASDLIPVDYNGNGIGIHGLIGRPLATKTNRNFQIFFVNRRLVKSRTLQLAFEMSYKNSMLVGRYPVCILFLEIDSTEIDVNVHPSKLEIKFSNEKIIANAISESVREALSVESGIYQIKVPLNNVLKPGNDTEKDFSDSVASVKEVDDIKHINDWDIISFKNSHNNSSRSDTQSSNISRNSYSYGIDMNKDDVFSLRSDPFEAVSRIKEFVDKNNIEVDTEKIIQLANASSKTDTDSTTDTVNNHNNSNNEELTVSLDNSPDYKLIGEVFNTYIIIELPETIMFIDKHALHERMIFEKLRSSDYIEVQTFLAPKLLSVSESDRAVLMENKSGLKQLGFDIDDLDGTLILREIPVVLDEEDIEVVLSEIASELKLKSYAEKELLDKFLYTISCKAAIKSGKRSSEFELKGLIDEYLRKRNKLKYCPHGRPIVFIMTKTAIEKQFRRIVG